MRRSQLGTADEYMIHEAVWGVAMMGHLTPVMGTITRGSFAPIHGHLRKAVESELAQALDLHSSTKFDWSKTDKVGHSELGEWEPDGSELPVIGPSYDLPTHP